MLDTEQRPKKNYFLNIRDCFDRSGKLIRSLSWKAYSFLTLIYFMAWFSGQNLSLGAIFKLIFPGNGSTSFNQIDFKQIMKQNGMGSYPSGLPDLTKIQENFTSFLNTIVQNWIYLLIGIIVFYTLAWYILHWQFRFLLTFIHSIHSKKVEWDAHKSFCGTSYALSATWLILVTILSIPKYFYSYKSFTGIFSGDLGNIITSPLGNRIMALSNLILVFSLGIVFFFIIPYIAISKRSFSDSLSHIIEAFFDSPVIFIKFLIKKLALTTVFSFIYFIVSWIFFIMAGVAMILPVILLIYISSKLLFFSTFLVFWVGSIIFLSGILLLFYLNFFVFLRFYITLSFIDLRFIENIFISEW